MLSEKSSCAICHSRWPPTTPPAERWLPSALDMRRTMKVPKTASLPSPTETTPTHMTQLVYRRKYDSLSPAVGELMSPKDPSNNWRC